ncbi:MAG TPA: aminoacyl--tRNA ligase-related protein [Candidatus Saccharimonadales bacterium]
MRLSKLFTKTSKTTPADETARNAQLLIQAGFIHKEMAGVYSYLPLGKKVLNNIAEIVRREMNSIGGLEVQMSVLQSKELWEKTDRWDDKKVDNWFKTKLANGQELGVGLTHEEPIVSSLIPFVNSYKDLPVYTYQIGGKFRNELRSKSGLMRGREFVMKDLYSFSRNQAEHDKFYELAAEAYLRIYKNLGLGEITYRTFADGGIFSKYSDEFQTVSSVGEDTIYLDKAKRIAVNKEVYNPDTLKELGLNEANLEEVRAVEVGNIFPLGTKYTDALGLYYLDKEGSRQSIVMGSYGLGISRLMGLIAEHFADDKGLVWPKLVAPALVYLARIGTSDEEIAQADELYLKLTEAGIEVIYDDRDVRAGEKFADAELMGIPYRVVVSKTTVSSGTFELKFRASDEVKAVSLSELIEILAR